MSSDSESDEEYIPGEPEKLSEEESANEETDVQYENEQVHKSNKRKIAEESNSKKKRKTRNCKEKDTKDDEPVESLKVDPVEEKKKEDDLWAMFLEGTDTKPKSAPKESNIPTGPKPVNNDDKKVATKTDDNDAREKRIFEFAGETIVVENNTIKEKLKTGSPASDSISDGPSPSSSARGRPGATRGGLSSVLGQLNKKNKLSTLEKSKLDWVTFKKDEGLEEEIQSHNKGRNGYLDKRDFLERADVRQYEIERELRMGRRSKR